MESRMAPMRSEQTTSSAGSATLWSSRRRSTLRSLGSSVPRTPEIDTYWFTRQIITAIKTATRQKHQALNQYVSISGVRGTDDPSERRVERLLHDHNVADLIGRVGNVVVVRGTDDPSERSVERLLDDHNVADPADEVVSGERMGAMRNSMAQLLSGLEV